MHPYSDSPSGAAPAVTACWSTIGVWGDRSCAELDAHVHCRNCPVHADAAAVLLDRPVAAELAIEHGRHFEAPKQAEERDTQSVVVFRIGAEWFAVPTSAIAEVTPHRVIHSVPHRRGGVVLGVVNVRGELLVCASLGRLLGVQGAADPAPGQSRAGSGRLLVLRRDDVRVVVPADEVGGVHRVHALELKGVPATVSKAASAHSRAVLSWSGRVVGLLDDEQLFRTLQRAVA